MAIWGGRIEADITIRTIAPKSMDRNPESKEPPDEIEEERRWNKLSVVDAIKKLLEYVR